MYNFNSKSILTLFVLIALSISTPLSAQQMDLKACIDQALQNHASIRTAELDTRITDAKIREIKSRGLPQVSGQLDLSANLKIQRAFLPASFLNPMDTTDNSIAVEFGTLFNGQGGITATQLIYSGEYRMGVKSAQTYAELSQKAVTQKKIDVVANVTKAYYGVLVNKERLQLLDKHVGRLDTLYRQTQVMFNNGFVEKLDVDRLQVSMNNLEAEKIKLKQLIALSEALLKYQMGMKADDQLVVAGSLEEYEGETFADANTATDVTQRIEYQMMETQKKLNELDIRSKKLQYYPTVAAFATYGANMGSNSFGDYFKFGDGWFGYSRIGVSVTIPIFDGFAKKHQTQQLRFQQEKLDLDMMEFERGIQLQASQATIMLQNSLENLKVQRRNKELAQSVYDISKKKYEQGPNSNLEVLDAETSIKEAETNYYSALYDALIYLVDLKVAQGTLLND